jgi:hypothetical protein
MRSDAYIHCRVSTETKAVLRRMAEREEISESALVKQILGSSLRTSVLDELPSPPKEGRGNREARLTVRLSWDDLRLLAALAEGRSLAWGTYAAVVLRSHLHKTIPLPRDQVLDLRRAVAELSAIGRNLNQIARATNMGERVSLPGRQEVMAMLKVAEALRDHIKVIMKANQASWRGNDETAH